MYVGISYLDDIMIECSVLIGGSSVCIVVVYLYNYVDCVLGVMLLDLVLVVVISVVLLCELI